MPLGYLQELAGYRADGYDWRKHEAHDPMMWAPRERGTVPTGVAVSRTQDVAIRRLAERDHNVVHWSEFDRGGHFAATEAPEFLVGDVRALLRKLGER